MKGTEYEARWNVIRPQYGEYLPSYQRKELGGSVSHTRVTRVPVRIQQDTQEVQPTLRKMPSTNERKDHVMNTVEQSKIISALKSQLSNLKYEVTKLISTDKDFSTTHNGVHSQDLLPPKQIASSIELQDHGKPHAYMNQNSSTIQRKPSNSNESTDNKTVRASEYAVTQRQVYSDPQLKDDLKASQTREKRLIDERDDLARTLQEKSKELEMAKMNNDTRSERLAQNKEASERQLNSIIDTLRRQHSEAEQYYIKRIRELEANIKDLEAKGVTKEQEITAVRQQLSLSKLAKKQDERQTKAIESLQQTNRSLTNQILELQQKIRQQQQKVILSEQTKSFADMEIKRLNEQIYQLKDQSNKLIQEVSKTREDRDSKLRQKIKQIERISLQKDKISSVKEELTKQLQKQKEIAKVELSKSAMILGQQHSQVQQQEQAKKQEFESLLAKIQTLKKDKRAIECDIKGLIETKQAVERSLNTLPQNKTVDELRNQLSQKQQVINNLLLEVKNLQAQVSKNRLLSQRLKANQAVIREMSELAMKNELANLNKRYL